MSLDLLRKSRIVSVGPRPVAALALAAVLLPIAMSVPAAGSPWVDSALDSAAAEAAYGTAADEISLSQARGQLLAMVNSARLDAGLTELAPLELATGVAQDQAEEMVARRLVGHYDSAGRACEQRFNAAGGVDQIAENTAYYEIDYDVHLTPQLVDRIMSHWLASASHRANILNAAHTHMGAGFGLRRVGGQTRVAAVAEFVNDYGDYAKLPPHARLGDVLQLSGQLDPSRAVLGYLGIGVDDPPRPIAPGQVQQPGYSTPEVVLALVPVVYNGDSLPDARFIRRSVTYNRRTGEFSAEIPLEPGWPAAAYYFTVWAAAPQSAGPFFRTMVQVVLVE
jgi:uncharacterized protein YkwD